MTERSGRFKDIIIVVLLILAILLLYFFCACRPDKHSLFRIFGIGTNQIVSVEEEENTSLVAPYRILADDGSADIYSIHPEAVSTGSTTWNSFLINEMRSYLSKKDCTVQNISEKTFRSEITTATLTSSFRFPVPLVEYLNVNGMEVPEKTEENISFTDVIFSARGRLYLLDQDAGKYYRIQHEETEKESRLENAVETAWNRISGAQEMKTASGNQWSVGTALFVDSDVTCSPAERITSVYSPDRASSVKALERVFFPTGLDFISKTKGSDGSIQYSYRNNTKSLTLGGNGIVTWTEKPLRTEYRETTFYGALSSAVEFLSAHGVDEIAEGGEEWFLQSVSRNTSIGSRTKYTFTFGKLSDGVEIMYDSGSAASVTVYGTQVTACTLDLTETAGSDPSDGGASGQAEAVDEETALKNSFSDLQENISEADGYSSTGQLMAALTDAKLCLYRSRLNDSSSASHEERDESPSESQDVQEEERFSESAEYQLEPAWYFRTDRFEFWCSAVDGSWITGRTTEKP